MKTKIIYISGNEIFDIADIRAAFEEVRNALNLDKTTVLFGVPVDSEDAGFAATTTDSVSQEEPKNVVVEEEPIINETVIETVTEITPIPVMEEEKIESDIEKPVKKRGRPHKETKAIDMTEPEHVAEVIDEPQNETEPESEETVVPILSVLSTEEEETNDDTVAEATEQNQEENIEIIPEIPAESSEQSIKVEINETEISIDDDEASLEKLLSAMTPLEEDVLEDQPVEDIIEEKVQDSNDISVDATLEQLATEFAENQDKIAAEAKSSSRSKIGKLRNILPFKQSKHKDQGLGDLFGWAGIAANDEDFSVPGFFTSVASKK